MAKKAVAKKTVKKKAKAPLKATSQKKSQKRKEPLEVEINPTIHAKEEDDLYPEEEQGILPEETSEEHELAMAVGDEDEDIYTEEGRKKLEEDDEITPWEEGLMEGASGLGQLGKDALSGKPIIDADEVIEMELDGKLYRFVSTKNAEKFREKMMKQKSKGKK
ncbi:MAG: hypothetical protein Q7S55_02660 [Nanoarchaeota archaeon]|nr:hypothetical protein [Nanoarchaeota archaeon]